MLKEEKLELLSALVRLTEQPFRGLTQPALAIYLDTGPRWSDPAQVLMLYREQAARLASQVALEQPEWYEPLLREVARVEPFLTTFLHSPKRAAGVMIFAAEWADYLEAFPLDLAPKTHFFYDYYLHLEIWLNLTGQKQAEVTYWFQRESVANRQRDPGFIERLGYGALELERGQWLSSQDVASFTQPEYSPRHYARSLLPILGKRFPDELATRMWEVITEYGERCALSGAKPLPFNALAQQWYNQYGIQFVKAWYFGPHCPQRHYMAAGHEWEPGPILSFITRRIPALELLGRAGFDLGRALYLVWVEKRFSWRGLRGKEPLFWPWMIASLEDFALSYEQVQQASREIDEHIRRLDLQILYPQPNLARCAAAIDYFRRLEMAGLGPEAVGV
jgi:hypothetical protein